MPFIPNKKPHSLSLLENRNKVLNHTLFIYLLLISSIVTASKGDTDTSLSQAQTLYLKSATFFELKQISKAQTSIKKAIELQPNQPSYYFKLAKIEAYKASQANLISSSSYAIRALNAFKKSVALAPNNVDYLQGLMAYYLIAPKLLGGSDAKAKEIAGKIVELHRQQTTRSEKQSSSSALMK